MTAAILYLALGLALLSYGAEALVRGSSSLALRLGLSPLVVGLTVVAFGTSSPELVVSLKAGLAGQGNISVGNVVGSNICNLGLILGICALVTPIATTTQIVRIDIPIMIAATALTIFLLSDGTLGRTEGIILYALLLAYVISSVLLARRQSADTLGAEFGQEVKVSKRGLAVDFLMVAGGLVLLIFGARFLVDGAVVIARAFGWSEALIGLTVIAVGTSLPELATSLVAAVKKEVDIAVGNIVGSNIFNLLGILGITAMVAPLDASGISLVDYAVMAAFALVLWPMAYHQKRITRLEGAILLSGYTAYLSWLVLSTLSGREVGA
jgi:cation:H+ antiporter